jgi:hypothetical protein
MAKAINRFPNQSINIFRMRIAKPLIELISIAGNWEDFVEFSYK